MLSRPADTHESDQSADGDRSTSLLRRRPGSTRPTTAYTATLPSAVASTAMTTRESLTGSWPGTILVTPKTASELSARAPSVNPRPSLPAGSGSPRASDASSPSSALHRRAACTHCGQYRGSSSHSAGHRAGSRSDELTSSPQTVTYPLVP